MSDRRLLFRDRLALVAVLFGCATAAVGLIGLAGLVTGLGTLRSFLPGFKETAFSTILFLILAGTILAAASLQPFRGPARNRILAILAIVAMAGASEFALSLTGGHFLIEPLLIRFADIAFGRPTSAISPLTAVLATLSATALFFLVLDPSRPAANAREKDIVSVTGLFLALAGITLVLGYLFGAPYLDGTSFSTTSAPAAVAFTFLGIALTASAGRLAFPARYFAGPSTTAYLLRSFVPLAMAIIVVQGFFHDILDVFLIDSRALVFPVSIILFTAATGILVARAGKHVGSALEDAEAQQKATGQELRAANEELVSSNEELTLLGEKLRTGMERLHHSEQALLESRRRLEKTQEMAELGSWDLDLVKNQLTWSDEVYRIFGLQPGEFPATYEAFLDTVHPEDRDAVNTAYAGSLLSASGTYEIDHRIVRKADGEIRYVHEKCEHVRDSTGRVVRSTGMVHDITGQKRAEQKLKRVIASWNVTFNAMNDRVCLVDAAGSILRCNQSMQELAGMPAKEMIGKNCHEVMQLPADAWEKCPLSAMMKTAKREVAEVEVGKRWYSVSADPVTDDNGKIVGAVQVMRDITVQKRAQEEVTRHNEELAAIEEELRQNVDELGKREQELRQTSQYLESLIEYANAPIIVWDPAFRITRFNRAFERLTGRPAASVMGKPLGILFPEDHQKASMDLIEKTISGERWETVEIPVLHAHGTTRTLLWNSATLYKPDGKTVASIIAQGQDITDRKTAEDQLQQALASWKATFNAMNDQICLIDRDGKVGLCNDEMCRFLGLPPDQIAGRRCSALMGIPDEDAVHTPISLMLASGKRESGELALRDQWFSVTADPIRNEAGAIIGGVQILRNITEKKEAEEAVRAGEETLRSILDSTGEAIYGVDTMDRCTFLNPACLRLLGYRKKEDLLGRRMHPLIHHRRPDGSEYPAEACPVVRSLATGEGCHIDNEVFSRADGSVFPVEISTSPQWKDGKLSGAVVAFSDISARKRLEAEMVQSLREKEVLLKEIHHRVKNNIQVISSILSLQANQAPDPATREIFRETQNKVRGIALIHEKLYRSKNLSRITYEDYLRDITIHMFQSYAIDPGRVGLRIDAGGVAIDIGKAVPLSLIVTELLSNALKHAFPDGRTGGIAIAICPVGRNLVLTFSDNGIGLPASVSFGKGDTLGMRLLAGLTRQLSGTIAVDRTGGTTFTITFPVSDEEGGTLPPDPARVPVAESG